MKQTKLKFGSSKEPKQDPQVKAESQLPQGLELIPNFLTKGTEEELVTKIEEMKWSDDLKRQTQQYGYKYNYTTKKIQSAQLPIPATFQSIVPELNHFDQLIVNKYEKGEGITKHTDHKSLFCNEVQIISLLSDCTMTFERKNPSKKLDLVLPRRSLLKLKDEARYQWTHEIKRVTSKRISLTFRNVNPEFKPNATKSVNPL